MHDGVGFRSWTRTDEPRRSQAEKTSSKVRDLRRQSPEVGGCAAAARVQVRVYGSSTMILLLNSVFTLSKIE